MALAMQDLDILVSHIHKRLTDGDAHGQVGAAKGSRTRASEA